MDNTKKVLSLFSGCGGMDLGFEGNFDVPAACMGKRGGFVRLPPTGFETVFANDIKPGARLAWENYFMSRGSRAVFYPESVVDLVKNAKKGSFRFPEGIDIVTGGFPCQDFSLAGKRRGFSSDKSHHGKHIEVATAENRGMLYYWMREVISLVKPKAFVAENVKGLLTLGDAKDIIQKDFSSLGYSVEVALLNAADFGVPQNRERIFFIGFLEKALRDGVIRKIPGIKKTRRVVLSDVLCDLSEPEDEKADLAQKKYSKAKWMGAHCQGQAEIKLNDVSPTIRSEHHGNIEFRRLSAERGGAHKEELGRGLRERRLTVRECARIQTFPDDYEFVFSDERGSLSASEAYKLIGNAAPPLLAYNIAKSLIDMWDDVFKDEMILKCGVINNDNIKKRESYGGGI